MESLCEKHQLSMAYLFSAGSVVEHRSYFAQRELLNQFDHAQFVTN